MSKKILLIILFLISACISGDKNSTTILINKEKFIFSKTFTFSSKLENIDLEAALFSERDYIDLSNLTNFLFSSLSPDNETNAFKYLNSYYHVLYFTIQNNSDKDVDINLKDFKLSIGDKLFEPIFPSENELKISIFNTRGTIKNLYNITVFSLVSAFVAASVIICAKEGKCENVSRSLDTAELVSKSGESNPSKAFSSVFHEYNLEYDQLLYSKMKLKPMQKIGGIILYDREVPLIETTLNLLYLRQNSPIKLLRIEELSKK